MTAEAGIPGYAYGSGEVARSPVSLEELGLLEETVLFSEEDRRYLQMAGDVLEGRLDEVLDVWYGFVGSHPHLLHYFSGPDGEPVQEYLERVRERFKQWVLDVCRRPHDREWLDYQHEIALRHTREKKNRTDGVDAPEHIPLRYMISFIYPITATMRRFLEGGGRTDEEVEKMHQAWFKAVVLHVTLWSQPYAKEGSF